MALRNTVFWFVVIFGVFLALALFFFRPRPQLLNYIQGACYIPPGGRPLLNPEVPYQYEAPPERRLAILSGVPLLKKGMSRQDVRNLMGDPDVDQAAIKPTLSNLNGEFSGIIWRYIIRSVEPEGTNTNDAVISVIFTPNDRLDSVLDSRSRTKMPSK
jgi:hypothetical protein